MGMEDGSFVYHLGDTSQAHEEAGELHGFSLELWREGVDQELIQELAE